MQPDDLDRAYTALCHALGRVGEEKAPLLLATLSLALIARQDGAEAVLPLIEAAEAACEEDRAPTSTPSWPRQPAASTR